MVWYPFHYHDVVGFKTKEGIELGTTSDAAAKHFDAWVTGMVVSESDPAYHKGQGHKGHEGQDQPSSAFDACVAADPNWMAPKLIATLFESMNNEKKTVPGALKMVQEVDASKLNQWELGHYEALQCTAHRDLNGALKVYDRHLFSYPKDQTAIMAAYFLAFYTGQKGQIRDIPARVVKHFSQHDRFYGTVHGKLCFGFEENGQIAQAEREGEIALNHTPKDLWAIHSMSHVYDTKFDADRGIEFLLERQENWDGFDRRGPMVAHVWWHMALFHIEKGDYEAALALYDQRLKDFNLKAKEGEESAFLMSDAVSLLLRLQMEAVGRGLLPDLTDRWREFGAFCKSRFLDAVGDNLFYDVHMLLVLLFGGDGESKASSEAVDKATAQIFEVVDDKRSWNARRVREVGESVVSGVKAFAVGNYAESVDILSSVRHRMTADLYGSVAQLRILHLIMLRAGVLAGPERRQLAEQLLEEHVAACSYQSKTSNVVKRIQDVLVTKA